MINYMEVACIVVGSQKKLAEAIGVSRQTVNYWVNGKTVSANKVIAIEIATKGEVTRHELRPDIYPD